MPVRVRVLLASDEVGASSQVTRLRTKACTHSRCHFLLQTPQGSTIFGISRSIASGFPGPERDDREQNHPAPALPAARRAVDPRFEHGRLVDVDIQSSDAGRLGRIHREDDWALQAPETPSARLRAPEDR